MNQMSLIRAPSCETIGARIRPEEIEMGRSPWYTPGDWALPRWWTDGPGDRDNVQLTVDQLNHCYQTAFGHPGVHVLPAVLPYTRHQLTYLTY